MKSVYNEISVFTTYTIMHHDNDFWTHITWANCPTAVASFSECYCIAHIRFETTGRPNAIL